MSTTPAARRRVITRQVVEWAAWDWGSAAFNAVATTFVFTTYLTSDGVFTDSGTASTWLSNGMTIAGLFIALLAPITGQRADRRGRGGVWLGWFTGLVVACMLAMYFVHPESVLGPRGALMLGIALLGLGNVFFEFASVNYNAMLNHLGEKEDRGKISGFGWAAGYIGGIVLLLILYVGLIPPPLPKKVHTGGDHESILDSYKLLWRTVRTLKNEAPHTLFFLIASAVFRDGLAGVFTFGAVLAKTAFGFTAGQVMIFAIAANIVAGLATVAFGWVDDKIGPKKVIILSLCAMVVAGFGVFFLHAHGPIVFWTLGLTLCVFVGPTQSASRSFLSRIIPAGREGEVFGLYATTGRAVSFMAPAMYSLFLMLGKRMTPAGEDYTYWGILGIMLILGVGLALTVPVKADRATLHHMEG